MKFYLSKLYFSLSLTLLSLPYAVFAQTEQTGFYDPTGTGSIPAFFAKVIDAGIKILIPFVIIMLIYSGFLFVIARGNVETLKKAKTNFVWTIVGVAILLGAKLISSILQGTVESITK